MDNNFDPTIDCLKGCTCYAVIKKIKSSNLNDPFGSVRFYETLEGLLRPFVVVKFLYFSQGGKYPTRSPSVWALSGTLTSVSTSSFRIHCLYLSKGRGIPTSIRVREETVLLRSIALTASSPKWCGYKPESNPQRL